MAVVALPVKPVVQSGITYAQAIEVFTRFCTNSEAAPTVAVRMGLSYKLVCDVLDGKVWPAARRHVWDCWRVVA